jgi:hypothetical protein
MVCCCEQYNESAGSIKGVNFLTKWISYYFLLSFQEVVFQKVSYQSFIGICILAYPS